MNGLLRNTSGTLRASVVRRPYAPLLLLLLAGVLLRVFEMSVYSTVIDDYYTGDAGRYIRFGYSGMFEDEWQPAGYALVLAALRALTNELTFTIAVQHALGLATSLLLYATARRAGGSRPVALIPAAVVLLSGDHLFLEHAFLMEALWMCLLAGALYASVRAGKAGDPRWIVAASTLLALSAIVRNVSLVLPSVLALWLAVLVAGRLAARVRAAAAAIVPAVLIVGAYLIIATSIGSYSGLGEMSGWSLYTRTAQFADCGRFTPPEGTRGLCESRPVGERPGPYYYYWSADAPARTAFPSMSPEDGDQVGAFARAAILHQPLDYVRTVAKDVVRYFVPHAGFDRTLSGSTLDDMSFREESPSSSDTYLFAAKVRTLYAGVDATPDAGASLLVSYQQIFKLNGFVLLALLVLTAVGALRAYGYARMVCVLCGVSALVLLVLPPIVASYDGRYAVPPAMLLSVSAALGAAAVLRRRPEPAPRPSAPPRGHAGGATALERTPS